MSDSKLEKQRVANKRWYDHHGDKLNKDRKKRYEEDPEYRQQCLMRVREYRANRKNTKTRTRTLNGTVYPVILVGKVAAYAGATPLILRKLEEMGYLPPSSFPGTHRVYTEGQQVLVHKVVQAIPVGGDEGALGEFKNIVVPFVFNHWEDDL